jgi:hypothetical protein
LAFCAAGLLCVAGWVAACAAQGIADGIQSSREAVANAHTPPAAFRIASRDFIHAPDRTKARSSVNQNINVGHSAASRPEPSYPEIPLLEVL